MTTTIAHAPYEIHQHTQPDKYGLWYVSTPPLIPAGTPNIEALALDRQRAARIAAALELADLAAQVLPIIRKAMDRYAPASVQTALAQLTAATHRARHPEAT